MRPSGGKTQDLAPWQPVWEPRGRARVRGPSAHGFPLSRQAKFMGFVHRRDAEKIVSGIESKSQAEWMFAPRLLCDLCVSAVSLYPTAGIRSSPRLPVGRQVAEGSAGYWNTGC